jgi:hypothetical protein
MMADPNPINNTPSPDNVMTLDLCVSDKNKELLLANPTFIPYLISGLILGVDHPRADLKDDTKLWTQTVHAECFAQLALFSPGCDAMRRDPSVAEALQTVATEGLSSESRDFAKATLLAMSDEELHMRSDGQKHVMLSCECCDIIHLVRRVASSSPSDLTQTDLCVGRGSDSLRVMMHVLYADQWDSQAIVVRTNESLIARRYVTWFDLTNMKGEIGAMLWSLSQDLCHHLSLESADKSLPHIDVWLHCRQHDGCDERRDRGSRSHVVWREPEIQRELELSNGATPLPLRFNLLQCSPAVDVVELNVKGS